MLIINIKRGEKSNFKRKITQTFDLMREREGWGRGEGEYYHHIMMG